MPVCVQVGERQLGDSEAASEDGCDGDERPKCSLIPGEQRAGETKPQRGDEENNSAAPMDCLYHGDNANEGFGRKLIEKDQNYAANRLEDEKEGRYSAQMNHPAGDATDRGFSKQ